MAKGVLGNDPFQRGAADRESAAAAKPAAPARPAARKKSGTAKGSAAKAAPAKPEGSKRSTVKGGAAKAAGTKGGKSKAAAPGSAKQRAAGSAAAEPRRSVPTGTLAAGSDEALTDAQLASAQLLAQVPPSTEVPDLELPPPAHRHPAAATSGMHLPPERGEEPAGAEPQPPPTREKPEPRYETAPAAGAAELPYEAVPAGEEPPSEPPSRWERAQAELPPADHGSSSLAVTEGAGAHGSQARQVHHAGTLAERASGALRLARDLAVQALASEGVGKAMGVAQGLFGALRAGIGTGGSTALDVYGKDAALVGDLRPVLDFLYERYWRVSVQGAELIPSGPVILVANHSGALPYDGPVMQLALARERPDLAEARWLVEDQVFHAPVLGTLFNRLGAVRACQENAERLLAEGRPVVVFPEGIQGMSKPFAQRYQLKRFGRGGFVKLALRTRAPIVPVAIVGAEESSPLLVRLPGEFLGLPYLPLTPLGPLPLPAKWSIRFGAPLDLGGLGPEGAEDLSEVQRLTERTRESIQGMLQALLLQRRSVFAG